MATWGALGCRASLRARLTLFSWSARAADKARVSASRSTRLFLRATLHLSALYDLEDDYVGDAPGEAASRVHAAGVELEHRLGDHSARPVRQLDGLRGSAANAEHVGGPGRRVESRLVALDDHVQVERFGHSARVARPSAVVKPVFRPSCWESCGRWPWSAARRPRPLPCRARRPPVPSGRPLGASGGSSCLGAGR